MTAQETAELKVVVKWLQAGAAAAIIAAFSFGVWVARLQSQVEDVPELREDVLEAKEVMADLVLLQCADSSLNQTERRICARYEPRMPR